MRPPVRYLLFLLLVLMLLVSIYLLSSQNQLDQEKVISSHPKETIWSTTRKTIYIENNVPSYKDQVTLGHTYGKIPTVIGATPDELMRPRNKQHLIDTLAFPSRLADFNFEACDMSTCFDFTLCNANDTLRVHIVASTREKVSDILNIPGESNIIHERILRIIRQSKYYEPDPKKACLFVPEDDTIDRDPLSTSFRHSSIDLFNPEHRFGMNYLIFNLYSGTWPDYKENDFSGLRIGAAILVKASNSLLYHRKGFDISIPLFSYLHPEMGGIPNNTMHDSDTIGNGNKTFFLTFKGKRYVIGSGSEARNSLYHLNNQRDVLMLTTCRHGKKWREVDDAHCLEEDTNYEKYDFTKLMNESTFCLTPRGRRLGSFRFLEALNYTCIPVVLGDGWVWPFDELIDWTSAAIQFPESDVFLVPDLLRDIDKDTIRAMQRKSRDLYQKYFATTKKIVMTTLEIIELRIKVAMSRRQA